MLFTKELWTIGDNIRSYLIAFLESFFFFCLSRQGDIIEYGDPAAIMGNMWWSTWEKEYYFHASHRYQLGWIQEKDIGYMSQAGTIQYDTRKHREETILHSIQNVFSVRKYLERDCSFVDFLCENKLETILLTSLKLVPPSPQSRAIQPRARQPPCEHVPHPCRQAPRRDPVAEPAVLPLLVCERKGVHGGPVRT